MARCFASPSRCVKPIPPLTLWITVLNCKYKDSSRKFVVLQTHRQNVGLLLHTKPPQIFRALLLKSHDRKTPWFRVVTIKTPGFLIKTPSEVHGTERNQGVFLSQELKKMARVKILGGFSVYSTSLSVRSQQSVCIQTNKSGCRPLGRSC